MNGAGNLSARIVEALKDHRCTHQAMPGVAPRQPPTTRRKRTPADRPTTGIVDAAIPSARGDSCPSQTEN